MERRAGGGGSRAAGLVLGLLLVLGGVALLAAQYMGWDVRFDVAAYGWPIFVILPGLALLAIGLITDHEAGVGMAVAGSIVTTIGLILSYQAATGHWASWAYAWTLIPTAVGVGMVLWGALHLRASVIRGGLGSLGVGLLMFLIFFGFFEGLIGLGADNALRPLARSALPFALIVAGALVILARVWPRRRDRPEQHERWVGARPMAGHEPASVVTPPLLAQEPAPSVADATAVDEFASADRADDEQPGASRPGD
jgi:hypothetical protein